VDKSEGEAFAKENSLMFLEVKQSLCLSDLLPLTATVPQASAKSAECVDEAFMRTAELVYQKLNNIDPSVSPSPCFSGTYVE
jgi:hypothetical protein